MTKKLVLIFAVLISIISYGANCRTFRVLLDGASFRYDSLQSIYEMYYSYPDSILAYRNDNGTFKSELKFRAEFCRGDSSVKKIEWFVDYSRSADEKQNLVLYGQKNVLLPPGSFKLVFNVSDNFADNSNFRTELNIISRDFSENKVMLSDIEIAQTIESETKPSRNWNESFCKNSLFVVPDPSLEIIGTRPVINIYSEIYNAKRFAPDGFVIEYRLVNPINFEAFYYPKKRQSLGNGLIETISLPVDAVPSGVYTLSMRLKYPATKATDSVQVSKKIYILNPDIPPERQTNFVESQSFEMSEFASMSDEEVEKDFAKSKYIATNYEIELFEKCTTPEAKKHFMFAFWNRRNMDTTSMINIERMKYLDKVAIANKNFSYGLMKDGWKTDRGRVLLIYGEPTQKDIVTTTGDNRAYETWFYAEVQGGAYFYFVDINGFGDYILVHSTCIGEVQDENWFDDWVIPQNSNRNKNRIKTTGDSY